MARIPFIKMHGCGNDYVFLNCFENPVPEDPARLSILVSDRHRSIGADGLVLMLPGEAPGVAGRMRMFNADGSEGALCGNALRCMAMWLYQTQGCGSQFRMAMADRVIDARIVHSDRERPGATVSVTLGPPQAVNPGESGRAAFARSVNLAGLNLPQLMSPPIHVSMGNPHTILFVDSLEPVDFSRLGPWIENHPTFPNRTNVEFVHVTGRNSAQVRVWERGSGETLACGSGACAVGVAGSWNGLFPTAEPIVVGMRGGELRVLWDVEQIVHLEGPAVEAFRGVLTMPPHFCRADLG